MSNYLSFEQEWTKKRPSRVQIVRFIREALGVKETNWEDLTTYNLTIIRDNIISRVSGNSAVTYLAELKSFLSNYKDEGIIPCSDPSKYLHAKREPSQHVALTEEEVMLWDQYVPKNSRERDVKNLFMRGCLTGARSSDCKVMTMDNIHDGILSYVSKKTHTEVKQPVHHLLPKYLSTQPKVYCTSTVERIISRICKRLGINEEISLYVSGEFKRGPKYQFVTMHSSRRSFCTLLAVRNVPTEIISKLAGHSNATITSKHYICIDTKDIGDDAMAFFKG